MMEKLLTLTKAKLWIQDDAPEGSGGMYRIINAAFEFKTDGLDNIWLAEFVNGNRLINHYGYEGVNDILLRASKCLSLEQEKIELIKSYELGE